jgi:hypothetical protein
VSERTVQRNWERTRLYLHRQIHSDLPRMRPHADTLILSSGRALAAGKPEQALADADRFLSMEQSSNQQGALSAKTGNDYLACARALHAMDRHDEARAAAPVAVESLERSVGSDHPETQSARQLATPSSENR